MMDEHVFINGLPLPEALVSAIKSGQWMAAAKEDRSGTGLWMATGKVDRIQAAFPQEKVVQPLFYDIEMMQRENKNWPHETQDYFLGAPDTERHPGDIDPRQSVLIGDLGPDQLIALDYRPSMEKPRVLYLTGDSRWVEVVPDIETLLSTLGINSSDSSHP